MATTDTSRRLAALSGAALVLGLALTGCRGTTTATQDSTQSALPAGTTQQPAPGASTPTAAAPASARATFTFPDGRISFDYPADWTVDLFHPASAAVPTATATIRDAAGRPMATVYVGAIGDEVGQSGTRTVYESIPVPGLAGFPAPAPHASFFRAESGGVSHYTLALTAGATQSGEAAPMQAPSGLIQTGTGVMTAEAVWDSPTPFSSEDAAKAWYASAEGRAVRGILLSLRAQ